MIHFICTIIVLKKEDADTEIWYSCIPWLPESEKDADTWHEAIVKAAILFLFSRKRGGCRHVARGHCDGRHFVSFL
jgi:hypothetical protein